MKSKLIFLSKWLIVVLIFALVARKIDAHKFYEAVRHAEIAYLILAALVIWVGHVGCIVRWHILLNIFNIPLRYSRLIAIYAVGIFAGIFLPSLVGGDVLKFYLTGRETKKSYTIAFASVFMDRNLGLFALVLLAFFFSALKPVTLHGVSMLPITALLACGFAVGNFLLFYPPVHALLSEQIASRLPNVSRRLDVLSAAFVSLFRERGVLTYSMLLSFMNHFVSIVVTWLIARALGERTPFGYFLVFVPLITLVAMIPLTPMGIGLREGALVSLFTSIAHMPYEKSLALGTIFSVLTILAALPGGLFYLAFKRQGEIENVSEATTAV